MGAAAAAGFYVAMAGCGGDDTTAVATDGGSDATVDRFTGDAPQPTDATADRGLEQTGQACRAPSDCYGSFEAGAIKGAIVCIDKVTNGYCTHECLQDSDCCAAPGECRTGLKQVCSSFENAPAKYCFLSCESADIASAADAGVDAGVSDQDYCRLYASAEFGCRNSGGGGGANRRVCLPTGTAGDGGPGDGGRDADAADAPTDSSGDADAPSDAPADG
jgi:hypothetical protein